MVFSSSRHCELLQFGDDNPLAGNANSLIPHFTTDEIQQRWNGLNAEPGGQRGIGVHIHFCNPGAAGLFTGDFVQNRGEHFAWAAPFGPKVHQDGLIGPDHFALKVGFVDFNRRFHVFNLSFIFYFYVTTTVTHLHKKRSRQWAFLPEQVSEVFTVSITSARVVFARSRSRAFWADSKILPNASIMQLPTGHDALGFRAGVTNDSPSSTDR